MKASVLVSFYRQETVLDRVLQGYARQTERHFEVIVCNDEPVFAADATVARYAQQGLTLRVVSNPAKRGYELARVWNLGAAVAAGERLIFTNADIYPCSGFVEQHCRNADDRLVRLGYYHHFPEARVPELATAADPERFLRANLGAYDNRVLHPSRLKRETAVSCEWVWGGNFSLSRRTFVEVGGFDEQIPDYPGEDTDLGIRLALAGCRFIIGDAWCGYHLDHPTTNETRGRTAGKSVDYLNGKWGGDFRRYLHLGYRKPRGLEKLKRIFLPDR